MTVARPIPSSGGLPVLGRLLDVARDPVNTLQAIAREHGDIVSLGRNPVLRRDILDMVLISHPDYVGHVLRESTRIYGKTSPLMSKIMGQGLLTGNGEHWKRQRKLAAPAFQAGQLEEYSSLMVGAAEEMLERWGERGDGATTDLSAELNRVALDIVVRTLFNQSIEDVSTEVGRNLHQALSEVDRRIWKPYIFPDWVPTSRNRNFQGAIRNLDAIVYRIIEQTRNEVSNGRDLLSMLMNARDEDSGEGMTDLQLRDEVLTIFLAGHETTAVTLTWLFYCLGRSPDAEARLVDEVDSVLGGRPPQYGDLEKLPWTRAVIQETLRLYPAAWMLFRSCFEDDEIDGYAMPAGAFVLMSPYIVQRRPDLWPDPERFDPERFLDKEPPHKFAYFPFGGGPRICIGNRFGMMEMILVVTRILQEWRIRPASEQELTPLPRITLRPAEGYPAVLKKRR